MNLADLLKFSTLASQHNESLLVLFMSIAVLVVLAALWVRRVRPSARRRRRQASRVMRQLQTIVHPGQQLTYLRKIDPFTFEELVLTAFQDRGLKVNRNPRYTGDGGIDGQIHIGGISVLIQAKRYSRAIRPAHVQEFALLCQAQHKRGVFVHTGRTGPMSRSVLSQYPGLTIISGDNLLALISGRPLKIFDAALLVPCKSSRATEATS